MADSPDSPLARADNDWRRLALAEAAEVGRLRARLALCERELAAVRQERDYWQREAAR